MDPTTGSSDTSTSETSESEAPEEDEEDDEVWILIINDAADRMLNPEFGGTILLLYNIFDFCFDTTTISLTILWLDFFQPFYNSGIKRFWAANCIYSLYKIGNDSIRRSTF